MPHNWRHFADATVCWILA